MFCIGCGKEIGAEKKFCPYCGTNQNPAQAKGSVSAGVFVDGRASAPQDEGVLEAENRDEGAGLSVAYGVSEKKRSKRIVLLASGLIVLFALAFLLVIAPKFLGLNILPFDPFGFTKDAGASVVMGGEDGVKIDAKTDTPGAGEAHEESSSHAENTGAGDSAPEEVKEPADALWPYAGTLFVTSEPKLGIFIRNDPSVTGSGRSMDDGNKIGWIAGGDRSVQLVATGKEIDTEGYFWYEVEIPQWYRDTEEQTRYYAGRSLIGWVRSDVVVSV